VFAGIFHFRNNMADKTFNSTAISRAAYDEKTQELTVYFVRGGQDTVSDVSPETYAQFCGARSVGQFFNANLKR
jgi:hypothetical protein